MKLLEEHSGFLDAISAGYASQTEAARRLLEDEAAGRLRPGAVIPGDTVAEELIWTGAGGGDAEIVRMALEGIEWPRDDSRWLYSLWQAFTCDGGVKRGLECFRLLLGRVDPNLSDHGRTILHTVMARGGPEHVPFVEMLLDTGARIDFRDELLESTALGWACRWGPLREATAGAGRGPDRERRGTVGYAESLGTEDETRSRPRCAAESLAKMTSLVTCEKLRSAYRGGQTGSKGNRLRKKAEAHHRGLAGSAR